MPIRTLHNPDARPRRGIPAAVRLVPLMAGAILPLFAGRAHAQTTERDAADPTCQERLDRLVDDGVLALDFQAFDQTMDGGWRVLMDAGCFAASGALIDAWTEARPDHDMRWLLRFHAGQAYAFAGEPGKAIARFAEGHRSGAIRVWDLYVEANIAFLRGDRAELERLRAAMAEMGTPEQPAMNLDVVDRLLAHFGRSYRYAYSGGRMGDAVTANDPGPSHRLRSIL